MKILPLIIVQLFLIASGFSQTGEQINSGTIMFDKHRAALGAAFNSESVFYVGNQALPGPFNNIRELYATALKVNQNKRTFHSYGLTFSSRKSGELISENNAQLLYAVNVPLTNRFRMSLGTNVGLINYFSKGTRVVSGGGDIGLNVGMSLMMYTESLSFGISGHQLNSPRLSPLSQQIKYPVYLNTFSYHKLFRNESFELAWLHHSILYENYHLLRLKLRSIFNQTFEGGVMISQQEFAINAGLIKIDLKSVIGAIELAYQIPLSTSVVNSFTPFQIQLSIRDK